MMTNLTETQQIAVMLIADDPFGIGIAANTLDALARKDVIRDLSNGNRLRYELTDLGRLLQGEVTEARHDAPAVPDDPFATIPDDEEENCS